MATKKKKIKLDQEIKKTVRIKGKHQLEIEAVRKEHSLSAGNKAVLKMIEEYRPMVQELKNTKEELRKAEFRIEDLEYRISKFLESFDSLRKLEIK